MLLDVSLTGADQAAQHYLYAPIWMNRLQPLGTPATARHGHEAFSFTANKINKAKEFHENTGKVLSYAAVQKWFKPRYAAWKADPSKVITEADVLHFLHADAWVQGPKQQGRGASAHAAHTHD